MGPLWVKALEEAAAGVAGDREGEVGGMSWGPLERSLEPRRTSICGIISMSEGIRATGEFKAITCLHISFSC